MSDLDESLRDACRPALREPGDTIIGWLGLAGVRRPDGDGYVVCVTSADIPPAWMLRGMLAETLADLDRSLIAAELSQED